MAHRLALLAAAIAGVTSLAVQPPVRAAVPRLWTEEALAGWALPIAGVRATPKYYTEAEYYAAPVDEVRTYPVHIKSREPEGYRDWMRKQGPQPLIEPAKLTSEANWIAAGREVFDGLHLAEFRTADPRAFRWADDPEARNATSNGDPCLVSVSMRSTRSAGAKAGPDRRTRLRTPATEYPG